jgi:hypothetical protein
MPLKSTSKRMLIAVLAVATVTVTFISWTRKPAPRFDRVKQSFIDSPPADKKIVDLDEALAELDKIDMERAIEKAMKEVAEAMKQLDADKLRLEIDKAMREVDMEKIKKEISESMSKVKWDEISKELQEAMKNVNDEKINMEIANAMKEVDMEKAKEEMKKIKPQIEKEMEKAKIEMEKAKVEVKAYKDFMDGLEADGLIDKKEDYTIRHENKELIINGKKASDKTYNKYRHFLEKHPVFNLSKNEQGNFNFNTD